MKDLDPIQPLPQDAAFEMLLRSAMSARPEPIAPSNLAARAMDLGRAQLRAQAKDHAHSLARQRRWLQISGLAAAMLIAALLAIGLRYTRSDITALASSMTSSDTSSSTTDVSATTPTAVTATDDSASTTSSSTNTIVIFCLGEVLLLGLLLMTVSRNGPTMPWGAEAAAGVW